MGFSGGTTGLTSGTTDLTNVPNFSFPTLKLGNQGIPPFLRPGTISALLNWGNLTHSHLIQATFGSGDLGFRQVLIGQLLCTFLLCLFILVAQVSEGFKGYAFYVSQGKVGCELDFIRSLVF